MFVVVPQNTVMPGESFESESSLTTQCPKGLCRGPCSDTLDGRCGTLRDQRCVWLDTFATGKSAPSEGDATPHNERPIVSRLQHLIAQSRFVHVCEIHAPRAGQLGEFIERGRMLASRFDAMNVTGQLRGRAVMPSVEAAGHLRAIGVDAVAVLSGRDCDVTTLMTELAVMHCNDVGNVVCLSGDGGDVSAGHVQMSSLEMLEYASTVAHDFYLGAVINPFSMPCDLPLHQLTQKVDAGADFVQTQMVFDVDRFAGFCDAVMREGLDKQVAILAGVPVVVSEAGLALVKRLPGVWFPVSVEQRLHEASDIRETGMAMARETIASMRLMPAVKGVHVMLLGGDDAACLMDVVG